jgi:ribulose-phosphate 3-epimerase
MIMGTVLAPSILSADFARLGAEIEAVEAGGAAMIHVDVMDGQFVPNITIGPVVVAALRRATSLPLDCHLMVNEPGRWVESFIEAGADIVSIHVEADRHLDRTVRRIRELGAKAGVVVNPATPLVALDAILPIADLVLVMSVNPGFGGQRFLPSALERVGRLRERVRAERLATRIEIDGGVGLDNLEAVTAAGADIVVAGSAVFGGGNPREATAAMVRRLAEIAERARSC